MFKDGTSKMQAPTILIMGPPGAGKGTQATHLVQACNLRHLATGDVLRAAVAAGTALGVEAKAYMERGELVPDDVIIGMLRELVTGLDLQTGILLDGFPRTVAQAEALDEMLAGLRREIDVVLDVHVPHNVLVDRLSSRWICRDCQHPYNVNSRPPREAGTCDDCGGELYQRADDTSDAVTKRLEVYDHQTAPVSAFYESKGVLERIDGDRSLAEVQQSIDHAVGALRA